MTTFACETCGAQVERNSSAHRFCFDCTRARAITYSKLTSPFRSAVAREIREGRLPKASQLTCVDCGQPARDYDHRDYAKPLDVQPVCRSCNRKRGPAANHPLIAAGADIHGRKHSRADAA